MRIFVTGSSGFIGFHLSKKLLEKGHSVHGYDSMNKYYDVKIKNARLKILKQYKRFSFTKNKLENKKILSESIFKFKPTIIIHLAAQAGVRYSIENPKAYMDSNITGTYNIIELGKKINIKHLLIASSSSVYGANKKLPFTEIDKTETQLSIYAATKKSTESIAHSYSNIWKTPITMLRFFTVYGPWGRPDMALFKFTKGIINKKKIDIYNNGKMYRDFTYVDDIVNPTYLIAADEFTLQQMSPFGSTEWSSRVTNLYDPWDMIQYYGALDCYQYGEPVEAYDFLADEAAKAAKQAAEAEKQRVLEESKLTCEVVVPEIYDRIEEMNRGTPGSENWRTPDPHFAFAKPPQAAGVKFKFNADLPIIINGFFEL